MPTLTFDVLHLADASNPADEILLVLDGEAVDLTEAGATRTMANGRVRAVFGAGSGRTFAMTCDFVDPADRQTFEGWMAARTVLLMREPRGRVAWGHVFRQSQTEKPANDEALVTFTFETISYDESV